MNATVETLNFVASIFLFLALVPALWIAGRIILRNLACPCGFFSHPASRSDFLPC
jgi:hypothetical protein